jgi:hypothetical protein
MRIVRLIDSHQELARPYELTCINKSLRNLARDTEPQIALDACGNDTRERAGGARGHTHPGSPNEFWLGAWIRFLVVVATGETD